MKNKEYRYDSVKGYKAHKEANTLVIEGVEFVDEKVNFADDNSVEMLATKAVHTADGIYNLINGHCDIFNIDISTESHIEMIFALAGLACEIYMKSIIYNNKLHNNRLASGHKLYELYLKIPVDHQNEIKSVVSNIDTVLPSIGDLFETLRYDFELNHIQGDYFAIFDLLKKLREISHRYPKKNVGAIRVANGTLCIE